MSKRLQIIHALKDRLAEISLAKGFNTDAGATILLGELPIFGPDDPQAVLTITVDPDVPGYQGANVSTLLPIEVLAVVPATTTAPLVAIEQIIEDIKKAVELEDRTLGGLLLRGRGLERGPVRPLPREPGQDYVGAGVEYRAYFAEKWGEP